MLHTLTWRPDLLLFNMLVVSAKRLCKCNLANPLDPEQAGQNIGLDLDSVRHWYIERFFLKKSTDEKEGNYPACSEFLSDFRHMQYLKRTKIVTVKVPAKMHL